MAAVVKASFPGSQFWTGFVSPSEEVSYREGNDHAFPNRDLDVSIAISSISRRAEGIKSWAKKQDEVNARNTYLFMSQVKNFFCIFPNIVIRVELGFY